jgi:hypothetical protein
MNEVECIQSKKACYEAVIQSEAKAKRRGSSDAECMQSEPPPMPPFSQERKPTQEEKEQAQPQERQSSVSLTSINGEGVEKPNVFGRQPGSHKEQAEVTVKEKEKERDLAIYYKRLSAMLYFA